MEPQSDLACPLPPKPFNHLYFIGGAIVFGLVTFPLIYTSQMTDGIVSTILMSLSGLLPTVLILFYIYSVAAYRSHSAFRAVRPGILEIAFSLIIQLILLVIFSIAGAVFVSETLTGTSEIENNPTYQAISKYIS